ncbi:P-loop containing nucleoside triphosphate hydrolase protein, partial [Mycena metata]
MPRQPTITDIRLTNISKCLNITTSSLQLLADTLRISGLEAILHTTQSLLKLAETIKQNKNSCNELMEQAHEVLTAIIGLYIKSDTGGELAPSILNHIAKFTQTLHKIHTFIEAQQSGSKVKTFFRQGEIGALLRDCKAELQQGFEFFQITNIITEVKEMQEHVQARHQEVLDIIETLSISDSASSISQVYSESYASSTSISMLPAEPKIFHGRENELADILKLFSEASPRIAILGAGGMGKTSLSRAVLHHNEITAKYHVNRFFIACDGSTNKVELVNIIGAHLGLKPEKDLTKGVLRHLSNAPPTLLILDNLETLWDPVELRKEIEEFLSLLTDIISLALMITMRGTERPSKVKWTRPFLLPLQPLAQDAAQRMFLDIADDGHSVEEINQILALTDNMPLVISLLAHLVDTEGCPKILARWETERTALLSEGYDQRSNLELSISLSLSSSRMTSTPDSQDLLSLLSILPDGLSDVELKQSNFPINNILGCKSVLLRTALAYTDEHKRLKVLVPIREYMQKLLPATDQMIRPLFKHFQELLELYRQHFGRAAGMLSISRIASNLSNIQNILQNTLHQGHPDLIASIYCACHLNRFSDINERGDISLFHLISPMLAQICDPKLEVYVITEIFTLA